MGRDRDDEVANLPPVWRRSLTESGMRRRATRLDGVIVCGFFVGLAAVLVWIGQSLL
jgi:hypothetical protein